MIGAHLGTMLDQMRADGMDDVADCIEDAVEHDTHADQHGAAFRHDCWFCYNECKQLGMGWGFEDVPVRKIEEAL